MPRTDTTSWVTFERPDVVTFHLPTLAVPGQQISGFSTSPDPTLPPTTVTIRVPPLSTWTTGLHFHANHTEYLRVVKGRALVTLGSVTKVHDNTDGDICIDKFVVHQWQRVPKDGDELVVMEWTDPADGVKEVFFRHVNSIILDVKNIKNEFKGLLPLDWWLTWQILTICPALDEYPLLVEVLGRSMPGKLLSGALLWIVAGIGWLVGLMFSYEEYTPLHVAGVRRKAD
ncbi:hypothetical protein MMC13_005844 [Lambiella insularis]|nr:hypothetical protein [Lambiella insularis]